MGSTGKSSTGAIRSKTNEQLEQIAFVRPDLWTLQDKNTHSVAEREAAFAELERREREDEEQGSTDYRFELNRTKEGYYTAYTIYGNEIQARYSKKDERWKIADISPETGRFLYGSQGMDAFDENQVKYLMHRYGSLQGSHEHDHAYAVQNAPKLSVKQLRGKIKSLEKELNKPTPARNYGIEDRLSIYKAELERRLKK